MSHETVFIKYIIISVTETGIRHSETERGILSLFDYTKNRIIKNHPEAIEIWKQNPDYTVDRVL